MDVKGYAPPPYVNLKLIVTKNGPMLTKPTPVFQINCNSIVVAEEGAYEPKFAI